MRTARRVFQFCSVVVNLTSSHAPEVMIRYPAAGICFILLLITGCNETAKPVVALSANKVDSYFGNAFVVPATPLGKSSATFDHSANQVAVSAFVINQSAQVPTNIISGTFVSADTGFLGITEDFAPNNFGIIAAQNPPLTGAWAVEIPGAGALANFLSVTSSGSAVSMRAAPAAMAENTACPDIPNGVWYLYVTVPTSSQTKDIADYGGVNITSQGSAITFRTQPYLIGFPRPTGINATGSCSETNLGALTAYPLNSFGTSSNLELISIGQSGLLVSSFNSLNPQATSPGAFGGGTGVVGVVAPIGPVNESAVVSAQYNGVFYDPQNTVAANYDITVLASAFGNNQTTSQSCSALQASLAANNGQGAGTVSALPSSNSLYGGEFLSLTNGGMVNDPTGANGSENCDVVIDLGQQDSVSGGLFPNATVFIGSNFPPYSASNPWTCGGSPCAVSFPAAAVVGQVQGRYVIFVSASAASTPPAQLPDTFGNRRTQPIGIYLFQKSQ